MDNFLPAEYKMPESNSQYYKFEQGDNVFRILSNAIVGFEDWQDKKPIRSLEERAPINPERPVKQFWAFAVWDYKSHSVKILEITQRGIQEAIMNLYKDNAWGNPQGYDLNVKRDGLEFNTKYDVIARPPATVHNKIAEVWLNTVCDLNELFSSGDPFAPKNVTSVPTATTQPSNIPINDSIPCSEAPEGVNLNIAGGEDEEQINVESLPF